MQQSPMELAAALLARSSDTVSADRDKNTPSVEQWMKEEIESFQMPPSDPAQQKLAQQLEGLLQAVTNVKDGAKLRCKLPALSRVPVFQKSQPVKLICSARYLLSLHVHWES
jgi:hypothetical protein